MIVSITTIESLKSEGSIFLMLSIFFKDIGRKPLECASITYISTRSTLIPQASVASSREDWKK